MAVSFQGRATGLAILLACAEAHAQLAISPVAIHLHAPQQIGTLLVQNNGTQAVLLQARTLSWRQEEGRDALADTTDLLAIPAQVTIPSGGTQRFRVALRHPTPAPTERAYRLLLDDATPPSQSGASRVSVRLQYSLPVMIAPARSEPERLEWSSCPSAPGHVCVQIRNAGNRRVKPRALRLEGDGWAERFSLEDTALLLAGARQHWQWKVPQVGEKAIRQVTVETASGPDVQAESAGF